MRFLFLLLTPMLVAQTPVTEMATAVPVCSENQNCVVTAISSPTAVLQFGIGTTWGPTFTTTKFPQSVNYAAPANTTLSPFDPASGVTKILAAQQQAKAYTVSYSINGVAQPPKTIPALPVATYVITCTGTGSIPAGSTAMTITNPSCTAKLQ